ncbi:hypothetical protein BX616_001515 [Lobosporangium transversale]|uniref:Kinase A anchor protein n=1 Tax=Lobosporangium transversale TaxID=64571 RepID=A0A1Y2GRD1_9FUNG|nr:kinase A anchor protein [Lobosporangium transversale]KAF9919105.1 hypothetical protein BX616_001515 [Lobosporangium transversale]ORZ20086.1 kinase A anchor protein [Lobosporangium transversale]|eukprot:XP_021882626.1 kinase A anchor protein [Lobosporangium transversale]
MPPKPRLTHFLAIPLYTSLSAGQLNASLSRFAAEVTGTVVGSNATAAVEAATDLESAMDVLSGVNSYCNGDIIDSKTSSSWIPKEALRPIPSLHLTLGVMSLCTSQQLEEAVQFLKAVNLEALLDDAAAVATSVGTISTNTASYDTGRSQRREPTKNNQQYKGPVDCQTSQQQLKQPLVITLRGLLPMQAPHSTSVLYAAPYDPSGRLQTFCESLQKMFVAAGFVLPDQRPLKLHGTIVNSLHARSYRDRVTVAERGSRLDSGARQGRRDERKTPKKPLKLDARNLIESWKDEVWAEVEIEKVAICEIGVKPDPTDGLMKYRDIAWLDMP